MRWLCGPGRRLVISHRVTFESAMLRQWTMTPVRSIGCGDGPPPKVHLYDGRGLPFFAGVEVRLTCRKVTGRRTTKRVLRTPTASQSMERALIALPAEISEHW